jgi:hypothetical protein
MKFYGGTSLQRNELQNTVISLDIAFLANPIVQFV